MEDPLADIIPSIPGHIDVSQYNTSFESSDFSDGSQCNSNTLLCNELQQPMMLMHYKHSPTCDEPCREDYIGEHEFSLLIDSLKKKGNNWEYSLILNKIYIKMGHFMPVQFKLSPDKDLQDMKIRALLVFDVPDDYKDPVVRCPIHKQSTHLCNAGYPHLDHVVRCKHSDAEYEYDAQSGRYSVVVPVTDQQPGSTYITLLYALMCKSSCEGGMNRRGTSVIFTLEKNFQVVGRQVVKIRVCSCPNRDMGNELRVHANEENGNVPTRGKKRKVADYKDNPAPREVKQEPRRDILSQALVPYGPRTSEPLLYLEVASKKHYDILLQRAYALYQARVQPNFNMYETLISNNIK